MSVCYMGAGLTGVVGLCLFITWVLGSQVWVRLCPFVTWLARPESRSSGLMLAHLAPRLLTQLSSLHLLTSWEGCVLSRLQAFVRFAFLLGHLFCPLTVTGCLVFVF